MTWPIFTIEISVRGKLQCSFVFTDQEDLAVFKKTKLPELEKKYGKLQLVERKLPGLKRGDYCLCAGEGMDVLKVEDIRQIEPWRWLFGLSHGCWEGVGNCYQKVNKPSKSRKSKV